MSKDAFRDQVFTEIAQHLRVHGPKDWHLIRDKYPALQGDKGSAEERKFYRWVSRVQAGALPSYSKEAIAKAKTAVAENLPAAPPPSYIAANPPKAKRQIDFLAKMSDVWDDLEMIRDKGTEIAPDGSRSLKNAKFLIDSVYGRMKAMETAIRIMQEVWDLQRMEEFYEEVISIIVDMVMPENPDLARRIMLRLKSMNDDQMMTVNANPMANRRSVSPDAEFD